MAILVFDPRTSECARLAAWLVIVNMIFLASAPQAWAETLQTEQARKLDQEFMDLVGGMNIPNPPSEGGNPGDNPPPPISCRRVGDKGNTIDSDISISAMQGDLVFKRQDLVIPGGASPPIVIGRRYESIDTYIPESGTAPMGSPNWDFSQDVGLYSATKDPAYPFVVINSQDEKEHWYQFKSSDASISKYVSWTNHASYSTLDYYYTANPKYYIQRLPNRSNLYFNNYGRLTKLETDNGKALLYSRTNTSDRKVTKITTADGNRGVALVWTNDANANTLDEVYQIDASAQAVGPAVKYLYANVGGVTALSKVSWFDKTVVVSPPDQAYETYLYSGNTQRMTKILRSDTGNAGDERIHRTFQYVSSGNAAVTKVLNSSNSVVMVGVTDSNYERITKYSDPASNAWNEKTYYLKSGTLDMTKFSAVMPGSITRENLSQHFHSASGADRLVTKTNAPERGEMIYEYRAQATKAIANVSYDEWRFRSMVTKEQNDRVTKLYGADKQSSILYLSDASDKRTKITDYNGLSVAYAYDASENVTRSVQFQGTSKALTKALWYNGSNQVTKESVDQGGANLITERYYDSTGQMTKMSSCSSCGGGGEKFYYYDSRGRLTATLDGRLSTDPVGERMYDNMDNLTKLRMPVENGNTYSEVSMQYNGIHMLTKQTDPLNRTRLYEYNVDRQLTKSTDPLNGTFIYAYDLNLNLTKLTDPRAKEYSYLYDGINQLTKEIDPLGNEIDSSYDNDGSNSGAGLLTKRVVNGVGASGERRMHYDELRRLTSMADGNGSDLLRMEYNISNQVTKHYDGPGFATYSTTAYDSDSMRLTQSLLGYMQAASSNLSKHVLEYDRPGRITKHHFGSDNLGNVHQFHWQYQYDDSTGKMTALTSSNDDGLSSGQNVYRYDSALRQTRLDLRNSAYSTNAYDAGGRLTKLENKHASGASTDFSYSYDLSGNITRIIQFVPGTTTTQTLSYQYDELNRLTREDSDVVGSTTYDYTDQYSYDAAGNRTKMIHVANAGTPLTKVYLHNDGNQLTKVEHTTGATTPLRKLYLYDSAGRMTSQQQITDPLGTPLTKSYAYQWDALDRLTKAQVVSTSNVTKTLQYEYNAQNLRARRIDVQEAVTKLYSYQGNNLASVQTSPYGSSFDQVYTVAPGSVGNVLEKHIPLYGVFTTQQYYQYNHRGDVIAVTNSSGGLTYGYHYDAFGNIVFSYNSGGGNAPTDGILMTGKDYDEDVDMYYFNARWYDPEIGRFNSRCQLSIALEHPYGFLHNNPIKYVDPSGRLPLPPEMQILITCLAGCLVVAVGAMFQKNHNPISAFWNCVEQCGPPRNRLPPVRENAELIIMAQETPNPEMQPLPPSIPTVPEDTFWQKFGDACGGALLIGLGVTIGVLFRGAAICEQLAPAGMLPPTGPGGDGGC